jgi:hypothetical protein
MASVSMEKLVASLGKSVAGAYRSRLDRGDLAHLKKFGTYLIKVEGKSPNTARAYQSWVAKALAEGGAVDSHVKSAAKAFARYWKSK